MRTTMRIASAILGTGLSCLLAAGAASAQSEECTWLPDLRCERSGGRWEGFEKPIVQPYLFEDPFITTGAYGYFIWQEFPNKSALQGGDVYAVALQLRVALTDRLAFIATKDGQVWERPDNPLLRDQQGQMNLAAGLKYALIQNPEDNFILSSALRIEVSTGSEDIFEGGSGVQFLPSVSAAWGLDDWHFIGDLGGRIPTDSEHGSSAFYHLYADYRVTEHFQPFLQISGIRYIESGNGKRKVRNIRGLPDLTLSQVQQALGTGKFEGGDLHNLGSKGMDNADFITWAAGVTVPITPHLSLSVAYERPLTSRKDIQKQRVTTSVRVEF